MSLQAAHPLLDIPLLFFFPVPGNCGGQLLMLGVQNVRTGSLRLLLAIGVALSCHAQKSFADSPDPSGVLEMRGPEASQNLDAYSPSDWSWLPAYKRDSLSPEPYTLTNRVWDTLSDEAAPLASVFLVHYLSKHAGLLHQALTGADGQQAADCARRLGEAVGDLAISQTPGQWLWRLFISNSDLLQGHSTTRIPPTLFWLFRRTLAYAPLLSQTLPDILRQHVLGAIGTAGIVFEPAELNDYFMLTFVSASASHDPGAPGSAFLDLDFLNTPRPLERPGEGRFEKALMALDALSRKEAITRVRLYPRVEPQENGDSRLVLFVRAWLAGRPGQLVRVPGDFGSARERMWWTDAVDQGRFQGVYNNDHYRVVQWTNSLLGYRKAQVTPLSDQIMEQLTSVLKPVIAQDKAAVAGEQTALSGYDEPFERQMDNASRAARDLPAVDQPDNRGLAGLPLQSMHHSVLAMGQETGLLFVDDWLSQRAELPLFTLKSRARYSAIAPDAVLDLENYLPPPPARGSKQLAVALARGQAYSWLVSRLIQTRAEELRSHREALQKYHPLLANDRAALEELASREAQLTQGRSLQELLDEQSRKVTEEHSGDLEGYREQQATVDTVKAETVRLSTRLEALDKGIVTADATKARMEQAYDQACESLRVEDKQQLEATRAELMSMDAPLPEKRRLFQRKTADYKDTAREGANSLWRLYEAQSELSKLQETLAATNEKMTDNQRALAERRAALHKTVRSNPELARLVQLQQVRTLSPLTESEGAQLSPADVQESLDTLRETAGGRFPGVAAVGHVTGSVGDFATTAWHALSATGGQIGSGVRAVIPARALSLFSPGHRDCSCRQCGQCGRGRGYRLPKGLWKRGQRLQRRLFRLSLNGKTGGLACPL